MSEKKTDAERRVLAAAVRFLHGWEDANAVPDADELPDERALYDAVVALRAEQTDAKLAREAEACEPEPAGNPYDAGEHRKAHEILARRRWRVPAESVRVPSSFPGMSEPARLPVVAVLVSGAIGDYTAYLGIGEPEWVADHGNKLAFGDAVALFQGLEARRYRP